MVLVASPSAIGKTPLAAGSRVPACPSLAASITRRTLFTHAAEVMPTGLSTFIQPFIGRPPRRLRPTAISVIGKVALDIGLMQNRADAFGLVETAVVLKCQARCVAQFYGLRQLAA